MPALEQNIRGVKRKRHNDKDSEEDKEAKLRRKLHHALRELRKVVKKARTFEVQKTVKKLKDARRKDPESDMTKDLEAQMEILKYLSYDQLAHSSLATKLKKDKTLSADPIIQAVAVKLASNIVSPGAPGTPTAKVQSRILSSKVLASEAMSIVEALRAFLHPMGSDGIGEATDDSRTSLNISKKRRTRTGRETDPFSSRDNAVDPEHENTSGEEAVAVDDGWESGTADVPSESDDPMAGAADDHDSNCEDSSEADFASGDAKSKETRPCGSKGRSEFLPSLAVGFTRGDSSSELGESELKLVDGNKKNRRGQRARRAIWEKKYGKNANHVRNQRRYDTEPRQPGSVRVDRRSANGNSSSQPRRTPTPSRVPTYDHEQAHRPTLRKSSGSTPGQSDCIRRKADLRGRRWEPLLHPSWEAKRKQKSASIVPSQGTKIVFSES